MKCPCNPQKDYKSCCEPFISGEKNPVTPEELMRSRYSAFALKQMKYVEDTTDPQTKVGFDMKANEEWAQAAQFQNLEVLSSSQDGNKGMVEFKATFQIGDQEPQVHHEVSKFRKQAGIWYFRDGKVKA
jgi:SEC-C motif-containing protein